jgi:hypothetical protein
MYPERSDVLVLEMSHRDGLVACDHRAGVVWLRKALS